MTSSPTASAVGRLLDAAPTSRFHRRAVLVSGVGFFTDAYDLFVISTVAVLVKAQWNLSTSQTSWVAGAAILGAFVGALLFGRIADLMGRKYVYGAVAVVMILGALASAAAPGPALAAGFPAWPRVPPETADEEIRASSFREGISSGRDCCARSAG